MSDNSLLTADSWDEILRILAGDEDRLRHANQKEHRLLEQVLDADTIPLELGRLAADGLYEDAASLVTAIGRIKGRQCLVVVSATQAEKALFPPTIIKKVDRAQQIALENRLPVLYLVSSSGRYVATGEEDFPDQNDWGRLTTNCSRLAAAGIFQATVSFGDLSTSGPLAPVTVGRIVLAPGSRLRTQVLLGETTVDDVRRKDAETWSAVVRRIWDQLPAQPEPIFARAGSVPPSADPESLYDLMPLDPSYEYETREVIERLVDCDTFIEYKQEYGRTLVCGYARIDGWAVGVIGNQKRHVQRVGRSLEVGGVLYPESADKGARFILDCNQNRLPLIFLQDVNGFMVGREVELAGIIRSGAKLVNAVANSVVPKLTIVMGGSYGAGNYALCGRGYSPRFLFAWPTCRYGVMGGAQAARTLLSLRVRQLEREGQSANEETLQALHTEIQQRYDAQLDPHYAAARLWVDAVIAPHETRAVLSQALEVVSHNTRIDALRTGVLQV